MKSGTDYYWYQNDQAGTPQKLMATNGLVVWEGRYDAFGNCQVNINAVENNLRFAGQYYDAETGLHYNLNRYYDPELGRYLRTDPFGDGLNLYAFCFNNPNGLIDPFGLCVVEWLNDINIASVALKWYLAYEHYAAPIVIGYTAILAGVITETAGVILTGAGVIFAIPTYGLSLIAIPAGIAVTAAGQYQINWGVTVFINHINNIFGTHISSFSDISELYPKYPLGGGHRAH